MNPSRFCRALVPLLLLLAALTARAMEVGTLRCEDRDDPLGVDALPPRLSWQLASPQRGEIQTKYRVLAATSLETLARDEGDLWDSGEVASRETTHVPYAGKALASAQRVFWKARAWDAHAQPSAWSRPAQWTMGVLSEADWQPARWIVAPEVAAATVRFRREFDVRPTLRRGTIFVCGLGQNELTLDGAKVSADLLTPGWTNYTRTCLYDTYDVTALLQGGHSRHAVGLLLGNGMYNVEKTDRYHKFVGTFGPLKAIALLRLEDADGTVETIGTDPQWRANPGPITYTHVYGGEDTDARLAARGWDAPGFDDRAWPPTVVSPGPGGRLRGTTAAAPPIRADQVFPARKLKELAPGVSVYDLGQNAAMVPRLRVRGPAGSVVRLTPAELLKPDGSVDRASSGGGRSFWQYTLAGDPAGETCFPKFHYAGFRYFQAECLAPPAGGLPGIESLEGVVVHSAVRPVGEFHCSDELLNRIYRLIRWAQLGNLVSVLTDCPHRERLGWLEQIHLNGPALRYNFDLASFFGKTMNDMADSQLENGLVPTTAPEYSVFGGNFRDSPEWGSAFLLVAAQQYEFTGDPDLFRRYYDGMARYVAYLGSRAKDDIVSHGLSDWYDIGPGAPGKSKLTPPGVTATSFYALDAAVLARAAGLLGNTVDAGKYQRLAGQIGASFHARFFDGVGHGYATGSQCANALPLVAGIAPPEVRAAVLANVVRDVQEKGLTAGDVGYRYLLRALADGGRSDAVYALIHQPDKPGYALQLARGATSLTEAWDANPRSSQNHFMLGQLNEWLFHDLAGIQSDPDSPGFGKIVIRPALVGDLGFVEASYDSVRGKISSRWERTGDAVTLLLSVPVNTSATVYVPAASPESVLEGGGPAPTAAGVSFLRMDGPAAVYRVGSGVYRFTSKL